MSNRQAEVVWLDYERCFGTMVGGMGAYYTTIAYSKDGIEHEVLVENDDFTILENLIEYDSD